MRFTIYLQNVREENERKPLHRIIQEAGNRALTEKEIPYYYFTSLLHKKNADHYRQYIGHKKVKKIINSYFYKTGKNMNLEDKFHFEEKLNTHAIKTSKILARSSGTELMIKEKRVELKNIEDLERMLFSLIDSSSFDSVFVKQLDGVGGQNSFEFNRASMEETKVPFSREIEAIVEQAAKLFPYDFIGLDIAITDSGPIVVEGNENSHLIMMQMACVGFKSLPRYSEAFGDFILKIRICPPACSLPVVASN